MTLAERLSEYVRAYSSSIRVHSFEHDDAVIEIARRNSPSAAPDAELITATRRNSTGGSRARLRSLGSSLCKPARTSTSTINHVRRDQ